MSNTTNIDFVDSDGKGTVTLVENAFNKGGKYYARFDRQTVTMNHLIARVQKREVGTNAITLNQVAGLFKSEILEALSRGEAVNLFDLGTLYISASGMANDAVPDAVTMSGFKVKFTPSKVANEAVAKLDVKKIVVASTEPIIGTMTDLFTGESGTSFTAGKVLRIDGTHLKISEQGGISFAPLDDGQQLVHDESQWVRVEPQKITRNTAKAIELFLPESLAVGGQYRMVLRATASGKETVSDVITIK